MKIAIVGSRRYENKKKIKDFVFKLKEQYGTDTIIVSVPYSFLSLKINSFIFLLFSYLLLPTIATFIFYLIINDFS